MKKIQKFLSYTLSFCILCSFSLTGCSGDKKNTISDKSAENTTATETSETDAVSETSDVDTQKSSDKKSGNSENVLFSLKNSNSWNDGSETIYQLDGTITNKQPDTISDWTVTVTVGSSVNVKNSWGLSYSIEGTELTITPDANTGNIIQNGSINFGIQLSSDIPIDTSTAVFSSNSVSGNVNNSGGQSNSGNVQNNTNSNQNKNSVQSSGFTSSPNAKEVPEPTTNDWLTVKKNKIVDSSGKEVWLTGCNWFGYNTGTNIFDGLWNADLNTSINAIADHGFNLIRIPISTQLVNQWEDGIYPEANFNQATNSYLCSMNSLEIFNYVIGQCRANGIKIMIDFHCATTDASGHNYPLWCDTNVSEKDYLRGIKWVAKTYKNDDTIIAIDLENEPHGKQSESPRAKWDDSKDADNWKYIAEKAGKTALDENPNLLVMVEGIEIYPKDLKKNGDFSSKDEKDYLYNWWGGNLRGVKDNPVDLGKYQSQLVYSPHDYGPTVYAQPWFEKNYDYDSLMDDCWYDNWFYIYDKKIAPLLIGEWGGYMTEPNLTWMTYCRDLIKKYKLNHTFWCFNANSGDTGGLVLDDFTTWDEEKYAFVKEVLWQDKNGKFVGLDHDIKLGENGISLSEYK